MHLVEDLIATGHQVTVLTAQPSYTGATAQAPPTERTHPNLLVRRFTLLPESRKLGLARLANSLIFPSRVVLAGMMLRDVDVVMAATAPPILAGQAASILAVRHRAAFVYHNQDIYPEVAVAAGLITRPAVARILRFLDRQNHRRATKTVVLSQDMKETVQARGIPADRIEIINNFDPFGAADLPEPHDVDLNPNSPLRVAFTGNLGRFQGLEVVMDAAKLLRELPMVTLDLVGDGALRAQLETVVNRQKLSNVRLHGYRPPDEVEHYLTNQADVGIVSTAPGVIRAAYPSKTFSYLRSGCALIALVEPDSELARTIGAQGVGIVCDPGDSLGLADAIRLVAADRALLSRMRSRARAFGSKASAPSQCLATWNAMFTELIDSRDGARE